MYVGVDDRVVCVVGIIGDGGCILDVLIEYGFVIGIFDFVFFDYDKKVYLFDL